MYSIIKHIMITLLDGTLDYYDFPHGIPFGVTDAVLTQCANAIAEYS